jgi:hypothetical protein
MSCKAIVFPPALIKDCEEEVGRRWSWRASSKQEPPQHATLARTSNFSLKRNALGNTSPNVTFIIQFKENVQLQFFPSSLTK